MASDYCGRPIPVFKSVIKLSAAMQRKRPAESGCSHMIMWLWFLNEIPTRITSFNIKISKVLTYHMNWLLPPTRIVHNFLPIFAPRHYLGPQYNAVRALNAQFYYDYYGYCNCNSHVSLPQESLRIICWARLANPQLPVLIVFNSSQDLPRSP